MASVSYGSVKLLYVHDRASGIVTRFPAVSSRGLAIANELDKETVVSGRLLQTTISGSEVCDELCCFFRSVTTCTLH